MRTVIYSTVMNYDTRLSKNKMYSVFGGRMVKNKERSTAEEIASVGLRSFHPLNVKNIKIFVDIHVFRPDMRADPINFVDVICDVIKKRINIDDRWFAVSVDWTVDKDDPRIMVSVSLDADAGWNERIIAR